jgi:glycosyltransferase involved in cell wall biosynthesis
VRLGLLPGNRNVGGGFQVSLSMIESLTPGQPDELVLVHNPNGELPLEELRRAGWETAVLPSAPGPRLQTLRRAGRRAGLARLRPQPRITRPEPDVVKHDTALEAWFAPLRLDLMLYPVVPTSAFEIAVPYIGAIHDIQHRHQPEFPEVSADGQAEAREYLYRNLVRYALFILVDSETGKEDVLEAYGEHIESERVKILPFAPPGYLFEPSAASRDMRAVYDLPKRYLFYPASFWPHKNHARLVAAVALLRERGLDVSLVLCGAHDGALRERTYADVKRALREHRLDDHVRLLGYVADDDMPGLYASAVALAMPTFFGPTNIPVLEAWAAGCPVITSDLRGIREQTGDAALLADPRSTEALAEAIARLWDDEALRSRLVEAGRRRLGEFTPQHYRQRLHEILDDARERVRNGEGGNRPWSAGSRITSN